MYLFSTRHKTHLRKKDSYATVKEYFRNFDNCIEYFDILIWLKTKEVEEFSFLLLYGKIFEIIRSYRVLHVFGHLFYYFRSNSGLKEVVSSKKIKNTTSINFCLRTGY